MAYVLGVDDNAGIRQLIQLLFMEKGYEVATVASGKEAIAKVTERCPDIILLDYRMPGLDGLATRAEILKIHPNIPIIMMSGYGEGEAYIKLKQTVKHYVLKPFALDEMCQLVEELLISHSA